MVSLGATGTTEANEDDLATALGKAKAHKRWVQEIKFYETKAQRWIEKARKILRRYKDERSPREQSVPRFNILWSNIQTLLPALYSRRPKPDIERRFRDKDELGRFSSTILERCVSYFLTDEFDNCMRQSVIDRLLPGRGSVWVRYEPHFKDAEEDENQEVSEDGYEITDDEDGYASKPTDEVGDQAYSTADEISDEVVCFDYVHWEDFGHTFGRTWEEVGAIWRKVYLTKEELKARFPDCYEDITLDYSPHDLKDNKYDEVEKKATIYEIWDKEAKKALWIHKDYAVGPLDEVDDPLKLTDFFPSPRPLFATLANDTCIPVPDYQEYQDQANELDEITSRIGAITRCVKVVGVYDASAPAIGRILAEGIENQMVQVDQWAIFAEKGGLKGVMELLPMQDILQTLLGLYEARDKVKQDLYEITGIADIIRGASNANETATAQQIKSQFGTLRLSAAQDDVQRFVRELVKICAEVVANHFSLETIKKICGVQLLTQQEKQLVLMRLQSQQQSQQMQGAGPAQGGPARVPNPQQGQQQLPALPPPQLPPLPDHLQKMDQEELQEAMDNPTWEEVYQLLKDEITLAYKIDIETDSTIKFDQDAEREARVQFLTAMGQFLEPAMQAPPELLPFLAKSLMFMMRGFKVGKELESAAELMIQKLEKQAQNPQQKPDPEMMKIQGEQQLRAQEMQNDMAIEQQKSKDEQARLQMQAQVDAHQGQVDAQVEKFKIELQGQMDMAKAKLESETKIIVAQIQAKASLKQTAMTAKLDPTSSEDPSLAHVDIGDGVKGPTIADLIKTVVAQMQQTLGGMQQSHNALMNSQNQLTQAVSRPRKVIYDEQGNVTGVH